MAIGVALSSREIDLQAARAALAFLEMFHRRDAASRSRRADAEFVPTTRLTVAELSKLLGISDRKSRAVANQLLAAGLLVRQKDQTLRFARETEASRAFVEERSSEVAAAIRSKKRRANQHAGFLKSGNYNRVVPVPRRLLVHLAEHGTRGRIQTALAVLSRTIFRKKREGSYVCVAGGGCSAGFAAKFFGVRRETFYSGVRYLEEIGWLRRGAADEDWSVVRHRGQWFIPNLAWGAPALVVDNAVEQPVEAAENRTVEDSISTGTGPSVRPRTLSSKDSHHEPAVASRRAADGEKISEGRISWTRFDEDTLRSTQKLLELFDDACRRRLIDRQGLWRVYFFALARRALRVGKNPPALFKRLVERKLYHFVTDRDEDTARKMLLDHESSWCNQVMREPEKPKLRTPSRAEWLKMTVLEQAEWKLKKRQEEASAA